MRRYYIENDAWLFFITGRHRKKDDLDLNISR